ncbi:MAG: DUF948 domain-containing protein [Ignavibacteriae bacterium]|nr:DUF948 domain-containing protein [Ignavibacteriota bacterium]
MDSILNNVSVIIQIILFITFIVLIVSITGYVKKLMIKVDKLQDDLEKFKIRIDPVIDDTQQLVKKLNDISERIGDNISIVKNMLERVSGAADDIIRLKDRIVRSVEPPLFDSIGAFSAIVKGVKVFSEKWKSLKPVKTHSKEDNFLFETGNTESEADKEYNDINKELNDVRRKLEDMKRV